MVQKNRSYTRGGGLAIKSGTYNLENVTIRKNVANISGGGIVCDSSSINFNPVNRCNLYLNFAGHSGNDLSNTGANSVHVILDTFTVKDLPAKYQAYPTSNFIFDIHYGKVQRTSSDLYVNPAGNDENDGTHPDYPVRTLALALTKAFPDSINPQKIYITGGKYSTTTNGEVFPINIKNFVQVIGDSDSCAYFDAESQSSVIVFDKEMTINCKRCLAMRLVAGSHSVYKFKPLHQFYGWHVETVRRRKRCRLL